MYEQRLLVSFLIISLQYIKYVMVMGIVLLPENLRAHLQLSV